MFYKLVRKVRVLSLWFLALRNRSRRTASEVRRLISFPISMSHSLLLRFRNSTSHGIIPAPNLPLWISISLDFARFISLRRWNCFFFVLLQLLMGEIGAFDEVFNLIRWYVSNGSFQFHRQGLCFRQFDGGRSQSRIRFRARLTCRLSFVSSMYSGH